MPNQPSIIETSELKNNNIGLLINVSVWSTVQQNINAKFKEDKYFIDGVKTLIKKKNTPGQPNSGNPLFRKHS
jgi:hypothetical protein